MRRRLTELGVPCPRWALVHDAAELVAFAEQVGWPVVLKTPRGGYDGKGVLLAGSVDRGAAWLQRCGHDGSGTGLLAEERVAFRRELACPGRAQRDGPGRRLAGGPDRAGGRRLPGGGRARHRTWTPTWRPAPPRPDCGSPGRSASSASWRWRCSRPVTGTSVTVVAAVVVMTAVVAVVVVALVSWSTSWRCARTTAVTGPLTAQ